MCKLKRLLACLAICISGFLLKMSVLAEEVSGTGSNSQSTEVTYCVKASVKFVDSDATNIIYVEAGSKIAEQPHTDRKGYKFLGWYIDGTDTLWDFNDLVKDNMVLVARYEKLDANSGKVRTGLSNKALQYECIVTSSALVLFFLSGIVEKVKKKKGE